MGPEIDRRKAAAGIGAVAIAAGGNAAANADAYQTYDALGLAELVRRRKASPTELLDAALARLERVNPKINALAHLYEALARAQIAAGLPEGPFRGVPMMMKDLGATVAGAPYGAGSRAWTGYTAPADSELTQRYKKAGLVLFGSTTTPELGLTGTTENKVQGDTRNPWNLERIAGGSSGGAAAIVAAGVIPMAHASDGGGSIRTPASCCGLFGMKPSRGRIPMGPGKTEGWAGMSTVHCVSRSVRDSAALMDASWGLEPGGRYDSTPPEKSFLADMKKRPGRLRIALWTKTWRGEPLHADCVAAAEDAARLCEALGHDVEEAKPPVDDRALTDAIVAILGVAVLNDLTLRGEQRGAPVRDDEIEPVTAYFRSQGVKVNGLQIFQAMSAQQRVAVDVARFMQTYDVILTPTLAKPPIKLGLIGLSPANFDIYIREITTFGPLTALANHTGQPSMSVPLSWNSENLPIGVMFTGRYGQESLLYRLAAQLEEARPWKDKRPAL
jgi:Asp-tRNA(Asn)/Glu-tRNA(Gln) amidotransferase A subunit family amidase